MIERIYKDLYNRDSVRKQMLISFEGGEITNTELYSESFELTESLCSESELRFGSCEASVIKFKIANTVDSLVNKWLTVSQILDAQTDTPFQFGKYKVVSDVPSGDRNYRNVTAYDSMYDIINADVSAWYESLTFPLTLKEFRDLFFSHFDITQVDIELIHDDMLIEKTISTTNISGKVIITAICELNGVFGHINRQGQFAYKSLEESSCEELDKRRYITCEYEDFETSLISRLQVRQEQNDIGAIVGDGTNTYIIEDNFLVYGKEPIELEEIATKIFEKICVIQYRPASVSLKGNPCMEVGDAILVRTTNKEVTTYILQRTLKGIQSLRDVFEAEGVYAYAEKVNSANKEVKQLRGKVNSLERTVEQTEAKIADVENKTSTTITQTTKDLKFEIEQHVEEIINLKDENIQETIKNLDKELQDKFNLITKYFTFNIDGLTIGQVDNPYKVIIDNDRYSMTLNDVEVLWIDAITGEVHTPEITITRKMNVLGYVDEMDDEGRINTRWAGGE